MINREEIHRLVRLFYQPTYKTFYVNSIDGKEFTKPTGVFLSLGMTTSYKTLEIIRDIIGSHATYNAKIVEISSKKVDGQFMNTITPNENPQQYKILNPPEDVMTREEVIKALDDLDKSSKIKDLWELIDYGHKGRCLRSLLNKLDESKEGWESHRIQPDGEGFRIYHLFLNYEKRDEVEYRIGIYIDEKTV